MIDKEEWLTTKLLNTFKIMTLFVSVSLSITWKNGFLLGPRRPKKISIFFNLGSQRAKLRKSLLDQCLNQTGTGLTTPLEDKLDASLVWPWLENSQLRISILDAGWPTSTWSSLYRRDSEEVWDTKGQLSSTTISSTQELCWTTQISSGGTSAEFFQRTLQCQIPTESGEPDNNQYSINTTRPVTDTELESQDTFLGMDLRTNQLCHILWMLVPMSTTVPSRETATQQPLSSEYRTQVLFSNLEFCFKLL